MSYFAKSTIKHNGVTFKKGDEVTGLSDSEAKQLVDSGVVTTEQEDIDEVEQHENTGDNVAFDVESKIPESEKTEDEGDEDSGDGSDEDSGPSDNL